MHVHLWSDVRFACRLARREPWPFAAAAVTIGLGLAAVIALFSIADAWLLRPLPFADPGSLVSVWETVPSQSIFENTPAPAVLFDWRAQTRTLASIGALTTATATLTGAADPERLSVLLTTPDLGAVLGIVPLRGRLFVAADGLFPAANVALITEGFWRRRFGGAADVVGRTIVLDGRPTRIVGVLPDRARLLDLEADVWRPLAFSAREASSESRYLWVIARMRQGVTAAAASADVDAVARRRLQGQLGARAVPLQLQTVGSMAHDVPALFVATLVLLLLSCANVASLTLARGAARRREFMVRAALGASRWRVARQLLTESAVTAAAGGVLGLVLAAWIVRTVEILLPQAKSLPPVDIADARVFAFAAVASLAAALMFGGAAAAQSSVAERRLGLKEGERFIVGGQGLLLRLFSSLEIALALMLLVAAGLAGRSFFGLTRVDLGFSPDGVMTFAVSRPENQTPAARLAFAQALLQSLRGTPGIRHAALTQALPLKSFGFGSNFLTGPAPGAASVPAHWRIVSDDYFAALGIPIRAGRAFAVSDGASAPRTAIVSAAFAEKAWPGQNPIGRELYWATPELAMTVVGVAADIRLAPAGTADAHVYMPAAQVPDFEASQLAVRSDLAPAQTVSVVRQAVAGVDRLQPVAEIHSMTDLLQTVLARRRFQLTLLGLFGAVAAALAFVGIYGVLSYTVKRSARELAVRLALGASPGAVVRRVLGQGMTIAATGVGAGLLLAYWSAAVMRGFLVRTDPRDGITYAAASVFVLGAAALACVLPARRASRVDPMAALKGE